MYEILIQVGRVVDLHIPRDKETSRPKGFAFAEYETEEIAQYAVRLFSGLVRLHNRTLKFAVRFLLLPGYLICFCIDFSMLFLVWVVTFCVSSSFWGQPNVVDYLPFLLLVLLLDLYFYL